jgi:hypothetical protein
VIDLNVARKRLELLEKTRQGLGCGWPGYGKNPTMAGPGITRASAHMELTMLLEI